MKRLPQLYYGDKTKQQIIQKWDPASKRLVNIYMPIIEPPEVVEEEPPPPPVDDNNEPVVPPGVPLFSSIFGTHGSQVYDSTGTATGVGSLQDGMFMHRYSSDSTNLQPNETILNSSNIGSLVKAWSVNVEGDVYTQTLVFERSGTTYLIVSTQKNWVYCLNAATGAQVWGRQYLKKWNANTDAVVQPVTADFSINDWYTDDVRVASDIQPNVGITGTPVIDHLRGVLYFVTVTVEKSASYPTWYYSTLNCVSLADGEHLPNSPKMIGGARKTRNGKRSDIYAYAPRDQTQMGFFDITDFAPGTPYVIRTRTYVGDHYGSWGVGETSNYPSTGQTAIFFHAQLANQRPGLTLSPNGSRLYVSWAGRNDLGVWHGWTMGFKTTGTYDIKSVFCTSLGVGAGIWMGGGKVPIDNDGYLYITTGNGTFNADVTQGCFACSALKLRDTGNRFDVIDYFAPFNATYLSGDADLDFGAGGLSILPPHGSVTKQRILAGSKNSVVYLLDSGNMGKYTPSTDNFEFYNRIPANADIPNRAVAGQYYGAFAGPLFNKTLSEIFVSNFRSEQRNYNSVNQSFMSPAYFNGYAYQSVGPSHISVIQVDSKLTEIRSVTNEPYGTFGHLGANVVITANGMNDTNPLVWVLAQASTTESGQPVVNSILRIFNKDMSVCHRDILLNSGTPLELFVTKYHVPTIYKGQVFMGGRNKVMCMNTTGPPGTIVTIVNDMPYTSYNSVDDSYTLAFYAGGMEDYTITWTCVPPSNVLVEVYLDGTKYDYANLSATSYTFEPDTQFGMSVGTTKTGYIKITPDAGPSVQTRTVTFYSEPI